MKHDKKMHSHMGPFYAPTCLDILYPPNPTQIQFIKPLISLLVYLLRETLSLILAQEIFK